MVTAKWVRHLVLGPSVRRHFPSGTLDAIGQAIDRAEEGHQGEICFAVEDRWSLSEMRRWQTARDRAAAVFTELRIWDTAGNTGVLIYVMLAEHAIEIIVDRAVAAKVEPEQWTAICELMQSHYSHDDYLSGSIAGIEAVASILRKHFPGSGEADPNELPDRPFVL